MPVEALPALVRGQLRVEVAPSSALGPSGTAGPMKATALTRSGCSAARIERRDGPPRERDERRPLDAERIEDGERVVGDLGSRVRGRSSGPVATTVAARVEGDDAAVAGEIRHLRLPLPLVHDRPARQAEDRVLALAERLVRDPDAAVRGEPDLVGLARTGG